MDTSWMNMTSNKIGLVSEDHLWITILLGQYYRGARNWRSPLDVLCRLIVATIYWHISGNNLMDDLLGMNAISTWGREAGDYLWMCFAGLRVAMMYWRMSRDLLWMTLWGLKLAVILGRL